MTVIGVAGTGTDIGKTWVTAACAQALRTRGITVAARKPAQSYSAGETTDAEVLAAATGEEPHTVCPAHRWFAIPMAPPMAAAALGRPGFTIATLAGETVVPATGLTFAETAGGLRSPIATDGDCVAYLAALDVVAVVLVADAGLGTINAVRLSVDAIAAHRVVVYLNRYDDTDELHVRNADWLRNHEGLEIVTDPEALADFCKNFVA
jgi:dethiobiotin synthetase